MHTKNTLAPFLNKAKAEIFGPLVEKAIKEYFHAPHPNSLEPTKVWEQKKRVELMELFSGQSGIDKTMAGFDAISEDLHRHLSPAHMEKISQEWVHGVETWIAKANSKGNKEVKPANSLMEILGISEETFNYFYQAAHRYFKHKDFKKASDAFYAIAGLDPCRYNVWIALGLSEAHNQRFEPALVSFSLAGIIDPASPDPYIFSAECCLKDHRVDEARSYIELAQEAVNKSQIKNKQSLLSAIQNLKQSCK